MFENYESDRRFGGSMPVLDTKSVRDLTDEEIARCHSIWGAERVRLQPQIEQKKCEWLAKQGKQLEKQMRNASPEQTRAILYQR